MKVNTKILRHILVLNVRVKTIFLINKKLRGLVRQRTIPTERPPLWAKLVPALVDRGCRVVSATNPHVR
jgi:hypothetical protein